MSASLSLPEMSISASDFVDKHNPRVLKRTITEFSLNDDDWKGYDTIRVICRFRPINKREKAYSRQKKIPDKPPKYESEQSASLPRGLSTRRATGSKAKPFKCTLDSIIPPNATQKQVFYLVGQPAILSTLEGFNSTVFAYGQSGSGKTYTMFGPENDTNNVEQFGLIPRCFIYLFQKLNKSLSQNGGNLQDFKVKMQLVQIYKRELLDLLNPKGKIKLVIKTDFRNDSVFVQNLRSFEVNTVEEAFACLTEAQSNRIVAGHALNAVSSRSHMLVMVDIMQRGVDGCVKRSKLNFGDLAGSEDLTKALGRNPDPERRQEAIAINSSLSALTTAISYLSKGKKPGYRDSPLTHILKDSLGGNSKTVMFVACSPHIYNRNETIRTLRFAQTAKKVKNKAKKNEEQSPAAMRKRIKELELKVASLQAQLVEAKGKQHVMTKVMTRMNLGVGDAGRSLSLHRKPGPIPGSPSHGMNTIIEKIEQPSMITSNNSLSVDSNMIKMTHNENEEWSASGSDEELVFSEDDRVDVLLEGEEELNYIHEIGELRRQLDDAVKQNHILNGEIQTKNVELEQCNNKIAELSEEADNAHKAAITVKRKLSSHEAHVLPVPGFDEGSDFDIDVLDDSKDDHDNIDMNLPDIPDIPNTMPKIIDDEVSGPYNLQTMLSNRSMVDRHEHSKKNSMDSSFSFNDSGNNTMLQYLMELQHNFKETQKDMLDLKTSMIDTQNQHLNKLTAMRASFINDTLIPDMELIFSDREDDTAESEGSDDTVDIEKREQQLDVALKRNLSVKKSKSCFSCFNGGDSDSDDEANNQTSMLVEEYLKNHVRKEMKKQTKKYKKKYKKKKDKRKKTLTRYGSKLREASQLDNDSYEFDNDQLSILTDSPTRSVDNEYTALSTENPGSMKVLPGYDDAQSESNKKLQLVFVDKLGDSGRHIVDDDDDNGSRSTNKKRVRIKKKPTKIAY